MYGTERPNVFRKLVPKESWPDQEGEGTEEKIRKAYVKMKKRAMAREKRRKRGNAEWNPELNQSVLVKTQPISDAVRGIISKFFHPFQGPYRISKVLGHSAYGLRYEQGKVRGKFNKKQLKQYKEEPHTQTEEEEKLLYADVKCVTHNWSSPRGRGVLCGCYKCYAQVLSAYYLQVLQVIGYLQMLSVIDRWYLFLCNSYTQF